MKYVEEFRDPRRIAGVVEKLAATVTQPWTLMEVCGGQTHAIARYGLDELLPERVTLIHGPGCPVCVTPLQVIEEAWRIAVSRAAVLCSFGDMLRVPGVSGDLLEARALGGDVRVVTSPLEALELARSLPKRQVVFFGVGFETTAPSTAFAADAARRENVENFSLLTAHVRVPPALEVILSAPECQVNGFLAAGHVCSVTGVREYPSISARYGVPIVATGFEPLDILEGVFLAVRQLESGRCKVENQYTRAVRAEGNVRARQTVERVFEVVDSPWRGIGIIPAGGLRMREEYRQWDAHLKFAKAVPLAQVREPPGCQAGKVLQGLLKPPDCAEFGRGCNPEHPLGAPMVSSEGACAAYYRYKSRGAKAPMTQAICPSPVLSS